MQTLQLIFNDSTLLLSDCSKEIANTEDFQEKLTLLELTAWENVAKQRKVPKQKQNPPSLQDNVLDHRLSHTQFFSTHVASSATNLHHGWWSLLKENIQKTLGHLRTTGQAIVNSCWRYSLFSKTEQTIAANEDAFANHIDPPILDATRVNPSTLPPPKNIKFLGGQQKTLSNPLL